MHTRRELWEVVLDLLPTQGAILVDELWDRARAQGLSSDKIGPALTYLCASDRAYQGRRGGYSFVRRVVTASIDFPLVARPTQARPRPRQARR